MKRSLVRPGLEDAEPPRKKHHNSNQHVTENEKVNLKAEDDIMSHECLVELVQKRNKEVLETVSNPRNGFFKLLDHSDSKNCNVMPHILLAIGKAITCRHSSKVAALVSNIQAKNAFVFCSVPSYLVMFGTFELQPCHLQSLSSLLDFLEYFQKHRPASSFELCSLLVVQLKIACNIISEKKRESKEDVNFFTKRIQKLEERKKQYGQGKDVNNIKKVSKMEQLHFKQLPDNFRDIPVFPRLIDIKDNNPFIRPILKEGRYVDTEQYLDIHFRLLCEDYIRPLRDSINAYLEVKNEKKNFSKKPGFKVYENVCITNYEFTFQGVIHTAHFDIRNFKRVNWKTTKRFMSGSLLCFTQDDFDTFFFATVARRKPEDLSKGILSLQFAEITSSVLQIKPEGKFTVMETDAFFEAFVHTLTSLSLMETETFPMKRYLIQMKTRVKSPKYLARDSNYDMKCLLLSRQHSVFEEKEERIINILDESEWPTSSDLNLDESQYRALKSAVTKEFTIIQGPPGTGKTHVGLRIVQLILENMKSFPWNFVYFDTPIVVVCYTNHALDQFLEGMLPFTSSIVRIGGRCSKESLAKHTLYSLRNCPENKNIFKEFKRNQQLDLKTLLHRHCHLKAIIETSEHEVFREEALRSVMREEHYDTLINCSSSYNVPQFNYISTFLEIEDPDYVVQTNVGKFPNSDDTAFSQDFLDDTTCNSIENLFLPHEPITYDVTMSLKNCRSMTQKEVLRIKNVWRLELFDRWRLYKYWANQYITLVRQKLLIVTQIWNKEHDRYKLMENEFDFSILEKARIVGMTTTGASKYRNIVQKLKSKIVVVEEAAEILEAHVITSLSKDTEHLILIGDHQQLRPNPMVYELAVKFNLNISLFERMINNGMEYHQLTTQHRMRPCIASLLVPHIYPSLIDHDSVLKYEPIRGVTKSMFFVTHDALEMDVFDSNSRKNEYEAEFLVRLCRYLLLQGYDESQITILTTYSGQLFLLKRLARDRIDSVRITLIDNFQGEENDIILISFVRSNLEKRIGFLKTPNRVCVALSRAKKGLYCIGNFQLFAEQSELWRNIVQSLEKEEAVGPDLTLACQLHKNEAKVTIPTDFDKVPSGGCDQLCEFRMACGHACVKRCHTYDSLHEKMKCLKPCARTCSADHKCLKKCYEDCGNCNVMVSQLLPECQHTVLVPCYTSAFVLICTQPCDRKFPCGHQCVKNCHNPCGVCEVPIQKVLPKCQHTVSVPCRIPADKFSCTVPCKKMLPCGHVCSSLCGEEDCETSYVERLHNEDKIFHRHVCKLPCEKKYACGHACQSQCGQDCSQDLCREQIIITLKCGHEIVGKCNMSKYAKNYQCTKPCKNLLPCGHKCGLFCHEDCSNYKCKETVDVSLRCGHDAIEMACYLQSINSDIYLSSCEKHCRAKLKCGHLCSGTCSSCYQGRLHQDCLKKCTKTLICGHMCESTCADQCAPCKRPCDGLCSHKKCAHECSLPCGACVEICELTCKHATCSNPCRKLCNRKPCSKLCTSELRICRHRCMGFCGEPCPNICIKCEPVRVGRILKAAKKKTQFVQLDKCKHVFDERRIEWLMNAAAKSSEIGMSLCPMCDTPIARDTRFQNVVKTKHAQVERVKQSVLQLEKNNQRITSALKMLARDLSKKDCENVLFNLTTNIERERLCFRQIAQLGNALKLAEGLFNSFPSYYSKFVFESYFEFGDRGVLPESIVKHMKCLKCFTMNTHEMIGDVIRHQFHNRSDGAVETLAWELQRFKHQCGLLDLVSKKQYLAKMISVFEASAVQAVCAKMVHTLCKLETFCCEDENRFMKLFQRFSDLLGLAETYVPTPKIEILNSVNMSVGFWYACPSGHACYTGACGKENNVGKKCSQCSKLIE